MDGLAAWTKRRELATRPGRATLSTATTRPPGPRPPWLWPLPARTIRPPGSLPPPGPGRRRRSTAGSADPDGNAPPPGGRRDGTVAAPRRGGRPSRPVSSLVSLTAASQGASPGSTCPPGCSQSPRRLVQMEHRPPGAEHDGRPGHMDGVGSPGRRGRQAGRVREESGGGTPFPGSTGRRTARRTLAPGPRCPGRHWP